MSDSLLKAIRSYHETEPSIRAWVEVNPREPLASGPLDGLPFGVKDIIETAGMATEYGSPLYSGRKGERDAAIVTKLREQGAILFGKTQTTAFAYFDPAATRNPRNLNHTPGGSSSGSAAAVAAGVVPFAIGTQTMGSIVRPAAFCGVVGFKPTFGSLPRDGVLPFAPSLDTVGFLATHVTMCCSIWKALGKQDGHDRPIRFGVLSDLPQVSVEMQQAFDNAVGLIRREYEIDTVSLNEPYERLLSMARTVNDFEGARTHQQRLTRYGDRIGVKLAQLVTRGLEVSEVDHAECLRRLQTAHTSLDHLFERTPFLLTPAALGEAPEGLASTGDPIMNAVWTALGTPVIGIPLLSLGKLPLGLQLIGPRHADGTLLRAAAKVESLLAR